MEMQVPRYLTNLAGLNFRSQEAKARVETLVLDEVLLAEREPSNKYDANAIKLLASYSPDVPVEDCPEDERIFIGYVEGIANTTPAIRLDKGEVPTITVIETYSRDHEAGPKAWMHPLIEIVFPDA